MKRHDSRGGHGYGYRNGMGTVLVKDQKGRC